MNRFLLKELLINEGVSPFGDWFDGLDTTAAVKVTVALTRLEQGNLSRVRWFRGLGEVRIDWGAGLRIYFARDGDDILLLLGGGTKHRQQQDIDLSLARLAHYRKLKQSRS
jgi:putative addiction module killer protein